MSAPDLEAARRLGALEAADFDRALRAAEQADLAQRLGSVSDQRWFGSNADLARLLEFQRALQASKGWRLLQAVRRPFGRAW